MSHSNKKSLKNSKIKAKSESKTRRSKVRGGKVKGGKNLGANARKSRKFPSVTKRVNGTNQRILIASGVNLDLLGTRDIGVYGRNSLFDMRKLVENEFDALTKKHPNQYNFEFEFYQTNDEYKYLSELSNGYCGAVINAGAWSHTSLALADRLTGLRLPYAVAHVSDVSRREAFRWTGYIDAHALSIVSGLGIRSYWVALLDLMNFLNSVR